MQLVLIRKKKLEIFPIHENLMSVDIYINQPYTTKIRKCHRIGKLFHNSPPPKFVFEILAFIITQTEKNIVSFMKLYKTLCLRKHDI